jgi:hypothetical protein
VYFTDPVTLTGAANDPPSTSLTSSIQWSSSRDGALGTGATVTTSNLSVGTHTIKAFVQDSGGARAAAMVQLTVAPIPANYPPVIKFTSFGVNSSYTVNDALAMSATATDREQGDLTSAITWTSSIAGPLGSGGTVFVSGLPAGVHDITARVVDAYGNVVLQTKSLEILEEGDSQFLYDNFSVNTGPNVLAGWQPFDDGSSPASQWRVSNGQANDTSNSTTSPTTASAIEKPGTYLRQTTGAWWLDYRVEAALRASDNDAMGLMFRYIDNNNYYRFSMDSERAYRRLVRKHNGVYTLLWSDAVGFTTNATYNVAITAQGANLTLAINGTQLYSGTDATHRRGTIALYAWDMSNVSFDNVRVTNLRTVASNDPPLITISSPANNTSFPVGSNVSLVATALDFEDGNVSSGLSWASSRDGALGNGTSLSLASLSIGAHVITASATDSTATTGSATVTITIDPPFNNPPALGVSSPTEGATFAVGAAVNLAATATDTEDGNIANGIAWSSSRDGALGTGASLSVTTLSAGAHVITATITDSGGKTATQTRNITVAVPNNTQPIVTRTAPLNGAAFGVGQPIAFAATATDAEEGNVTSRITWSSNRDGALGNGGTLNLSTLTGGVHTITTTVTDTTGGSHAATTTINVVPTAATLLRDDFNDNNSTGWSVTDEGTTNAPSAWNASTGVLVQTSNIHTTPVTAANVARPGTFSRWTAGSAWTNYSLTAELRAGDDDVIGVMFRYTNTSNYYRFSIDRERPSRRLQKKRNGTWTTIWSDATAYNLNQTYVVEVIANGSTITVKVDGTQLWSGTDTNALTTGTVAMYAWNNTDARFDNVLVRDLGVPFSRSVPLIRPLEELLQSRPWSPLLAGAPEKKPVRVAMLTNGGGR